MVRFFLRKGTMRHLGMPPGTLVPRGDQEITPGRIDVIDYDADELREEQSTTVAELSRFAESKTVTWVNVTGVEDVEMLAEVGSQFDVHPLVLEDISNTSQRAKLEDYDTYLYVVLRMLQYNSETRVLDSEQVSFILGNNRVISFQEREGDVFDPIRDRIRQGRGRIRHMGADYLMYALLDAVVDNYFIVLDHLGERMEWVDERVMGSPQQSLLREIHRLKTNVIYLRKCVWPLREAISSMEKTESPLIKKPTRVFTRNLYDHTIQLIETIETSRDFAAGLFDIYLSSVSNRMNEVMKVLTIIATIFIPITFVAGVYGMNFDAMPELQQPWGYPAALALMALIVVGMLVYFKRRDWL